MTFFFLWCQPCVRVVKLEGTKVYVDTYSHAKANRKCIQCLLSMVTWTHKTFPECWTYHLALLVQNKASKRLEVREPKSEVFQYSVHLFLQMQDWEPDDDLARGKSNVGARCKILEGTLPQVTNRTCMSVCRNMMTVAEDQVCRFDC